MPGRVRRPEPTSPRQHLRPDVLAPYFVVAALVHVIAIATRFDLIAAKLPAGAPLALMLAQVPLLFVSGYFEGRLDYGGDRKSTPMWMRIDSKPVKLAIAFGCMYLAVLAAQTWGLKVGPLDPTPPKAFAPEVRAMWFAMFTLGGAVIFFMAAAGLVIPLLRGLTFPLRLLPTWIGAVLAVLIGGGLGVVVMAALQSTELATFIATTKAQLAARPLVTLGLTCAALIGPLVAGLKKRPDLAVGSR